MCQTAFALVPACDEHGVPSRLSGRLVGYPKVIEIGTCGSVPTSLSASRLMEVMSDFIR